MKVIIFILSIWSIQNFFHTQKIIWNENEKLSFSDFELIDCQNVENPKEISAESFVGISYSYDEDQDGFDYQINAIFDSKKSWMCASQNTNVELLNHEQRHFDIAEIYKRQCLDSLEMLKSKNILLDKTLFMKIFSYHKIGMLKFQTDYDLKTDHGINPLKQISFNNKIDCMLKTK